MAKVKKQATATKKQETKKPTKTKEPEIRSSQELGDIILESMENFKADHEKWQQKNVAQAGKRARGYLGEIKKLTTEYRKATLNETKEMKG